MEEILVEKKDLQIDHISEYTKSYSVERNIRLESVSREAHLDMPGDRIIRCLRLSYDEKK